MTGTTDTVKRVGTVTKMARLTGEQPMFVNPARRRHVDKQAQQPVQKTSLRFL
jgi:hypothetical protein